VTKEEQDAVDRIKWAAPLRFPEDRSPSDFVMDLGPLIAAEIRKAVAAEREACGVIAIAASEDPRVAVHTASHGQLCSAHAPAIIADRIRARSR
jgi:hypothetical protein